MKAVRKFLKVNKVLIELLLAVLLVLITIINSIDNHKIQKKIFKLETLNYLPRFNIYSYIDTIRNIYNKRVDKTIIEIENKGFKGINNYKSEIYCFYKVQVEIRNNVSDVYIPIDAYYGKREYIDSTTLDIWIYDNFEEIISKFINDSKDNIKSRNIQSLYSNYITICKINYDDFDNNKTIKYYKYDDYFIEIPENEGRMFELKFRNEHKFRLDTMSSKSFIQMVLNNVP